MSFGASVLITGASRGIGLELVKQLSALPKPPTHIFATCRSPDSASDLQYLSERNQSIHVLKLDVTKLSDIDEAFDKVSSISGALNLLINNAGLMIRCTLEDVTHKAMMDTYETNTVGPTMMSKKFAPLLKQTSSANGHLALGSSRAAIINISTGVASISETSSTFILAYRTSKAALNMVTKCTALEFAKDNILVAAIHPGWVKTEIGGPNSQIDVEESVNDVLKVLATLGMDGSGKFYDRRDGRVIPF